MNKTSFEIKKGIKVHCIKTDLYKTDIVCVIMTVPLNRDDVTKNALIPFLLRRGTNNLPDQYLIRKELDNLYDASFNCGIDKMGDNIVLKFYIESINNDYALNQENILSSSIKNLLDIVFNPLQNEGILNEGFLEIEKQSLRKVIESKIDNKDSYALDRCIAEMYGDEHYGLYKYGYIEDIDKITIDDITKHYNNVIETAKIDIFISGNIKQDEILNELSSNENIKKLNPREENYIINNVSTESKQIVENIKQIEEKMDITQGKLVLGLDVCSNMDNIQTVGLVYNTILGDGANSMLFQNVREKASLAYSTKSNFIKQKLNVFIRCGIQIENYEKALEIIKEQLEILKLGNFTDDDVENAKTYLISSIKNIEEEQDTEIVFYIGQEISKTNLSPEEYMKKVNEVSKEQIIEFAQSVNLNTIYFLRN